MTPNWDSEEDDFIPLSALNAFLYCERRAALRHMENLFVHNEHTRKGEILHARADTPGTERRQSPATPSPETSAPPQSQSQPPSESESSAKTRSRVQTKAKPQPIDAGEGSPAVRTERGLWVASRRLGLYGRADLVEFRGRGGTPFPVEYKRGRHRRWDNDDVQLCAQGLCLEETLGTPVPKGAIYHAQSQKRRIVAFDAELRGLTERTAGRLRELLKGDHVPEAVLKPQCNGCSLREHCLPDVFDHRRRLLKFQRELFTPELSDPI